MRPYRALLLACAALSLIFRSEALAADEPEAPATPSTTDGIKVSNFTVSGYVDVSYQHLSGTGQFSNGSPDRVFDTHPERFTLQQAAITIANQPKAGFGALLNLIAGEDPDVFAPYDLNPGAHSKFDFPQAYVQYATGPLTVIAGRFVTLAGYETIDPRTDTNFSRSIVYGFAIPFAHTGVRATVVASDQLTINVGIVNGWDDLKDTNSAKTAEFGVTFTPNKAVSVTADGYIGQERIGGLTNVGPEGQRKLIDVIASWTPADALTLVLNYDWGRQDRGAAHGGAARWDGLAGYVNYAVSDRWRLSFRSEYLNDRDGYRTLTPQYWRESTLTVAWMPSKVVEIRLEGRLDHSDRADFVKDSAYFDSGPDPMYLSNQQGSVAIEGLYKF